MYTDTAKIVLMNKIDEGVERGRRYATAVLECVELTRPPVLLGKREHISYVIAWLMGWDEQK